MKNQTSNPTVDLHCDCCLGKTGKVVYTGLTSIYSDDKWTVAECTSCKNIITLPVPSSDLLNKIYSQTYLYNVHLLALGEKKFRSRGMAKYLRTILPPKNNKTILEIGCMYGYLLTEIKDEYNVKGIEIGDDAVNYCIQQGLDVKKMSMEDYLASNNDKFDLIILSHVFEHLLSPDKILEQLRDRLNPGGMVVLLVPNSDSINRKLFGHYWGWWQVPVHINHFCESAFRKLSEKSNLQLEKVRFKGGDSLMLLLNLINLFGFRSKEQEQGFFQKIIIRFFTFFLRYWYHLGNEEITVVMRKK